MQTYLNKLINDDMENRLVKLKMDDTKNEEDIKKEMVEIESECVSKTVFCFPSTSICKEGGPERLY